MKTKIELSKGNKIIADFMGIQPANFNKSHAEKNYHNDWNWLMNVVNHVENDWYVHIQISRFNCFIHWMGAEPENSELLYFLNNFKGIDNDDESKILVVWQSIVDFINLTKALKKP